MEIYKAYTTVWKYIEHIEINAKLWKLQKCKLRVQKKRKEKYIETFFIMEYIE